MKTKFIALTVLVLGFLLGASALSVLAQWSAPTQTPPAGNVPAPVNVGSSAQEKLGALSVNWMATGFSDIGLRFNGKIQMIDGNQGAGKVLTSDANGVGTWQSVSPSSSASGMVVFTGAGTWTVPAGAKYARVVVVGAGRVSRMSNGAVTGRSHGGLAMDIIPLTGSSATITTTSNSISFTNGSRTLTATHGGTGTGGALNASGPYLGFGDGDVNPLGTGAAVIIEYY